MPIGAIRSLTTEVGAGRSVPGATAALGTPSLPKGPPGSVFALYVPNRQTLSCLSRTRALVFTFCLLHPNEGKPTVLGLGLAAGPLDLVFSGRLTFGWGSSLGHRSDLVGVAGSAALTARPPVKCLAESSMGTSLATRGHRAVFRRHLETQPAGGDASTDRGRGRRGLSRRRWLCGSWGYPRARGPVASRRNVSHFRQMATVLRQELWCRSASCAGCSGSASSPSRERSSSPPRLARRNAPGPARQWLTTFALQPSGRVSEPLLAPLLVDA